jgi:hypothetical protein
MNITIMELQIRQVNDVEGESGLERNNDKKLKPEDGRK